jgi:hypothetical protein
VSNLTLTEEIAAIPIAEQVSAFLQIISTPGEVLELRVVQSSEGGDIIRQEWFDAGDVGKIIERAKFWNSRKFNIFVGVNARRELGLSGNVNATSANALCCDCDPANGFTSIEDFLDRVATAGLPEPSAVVNSGHGGWTYWTLDKALGDMAEWTRLQGALSKLLGTDPSIKNGERIVRVPAFMNWKPPEAKAFLWSVNTSLTYSLDLFRQLLAPHIEMDRPAPASALRPLEATSDSHATLLRRARCYAAKYDGVAQGSKGTSGRNDLIYNVAGRLAAFVGDDGATLTESEIMTLAGEVNRRCSPPLGELEFEKAVRHGVKYNTKREPKPSTPFSPRARLSHSASMGGSR